MTKTAIIQVTEAGSDIARVVCQETGGTVIPRTDLGAHWPEVEAVVFIGAMGICVRTIAPYLTDKHTDPAVVCIDSAGRHVIPVVSGHVGGANELALRLAAALPGAEAVVTTQSDTQGLWPLDTLAQRYGWTAEMQGTTMNEAIFRFVGKEPVALLIETRDAGSEFLQRTCPPHVRCITSESDVDAAHDHLLIAVSPRRLHSEIPVLQYIPKTLCVGIGLAHQAEPAADILRQIQQCVEENGWLWQAVRTFATIDVKRDEPVVKLLQSKGYTVQFYTAEQLAAVPVPTPSDVVASHVGTPSVSEAAALLASEGGSLVMNKKKGENYTVAVSALPLGEVGGGLGPFIEIVGAGPGDPDLISVRGRRMLERADLILYAGSLVPRELTLCARPEAVVRSSASMSLEEQCALMQEHYDQGHFIVRLHTGDPCIFGAIQEQMAYFDAHHMHYHITPGISSFLAAAAELRSQFTIPERCQTIILTRGEGRTPMPEREKLHLLARSRSTMCIFLSASIVDDVQQQLLTEYPPETPVAACYHLTWPDQRIYRGQLKDLARIVHDNHLTLTTMLVVGDAIDNRQGLSELYSAHFSHLFREASE
ncbi:MAG: precorrin-4 C(11)-methyltransferase [Bacteroidaceae bacterium]|nr:precorrin-4 C(11)-methyltransferase [Bacteroidaceae bacterium]